ncbi:MAG: hypothetical protein IPL09_15135 [Bacteroidetes bacterium]|nr:hypothetical protein [Bacteroidota bacterium]
MGDDANNGDAKTKSGNDFCSQLTNILQSGKENKFKAIEGKLTNADTKINDSKIKLKGARKNYLSWFKKKGLLLLNSNQVMITNYCSKTLRICKPS